MRVAILLLLLACFKPSFSQNIFKGTPYITNYTKEEYNASAENWAIIQDQNGKLLFGNHYGLIEFNGMEWDYAVQPENRSIVRSLSMGSTGTIYIGAQNEIGLLKRDSVHQYHYKNLNSLIPSQYQNFGDVWHTIRSGNEIIFGTTNYLFIFDHDTINILQPENLFDGLFKTEDHILLVDQGNSIYKYLDHALKPITVSLHNALSDIVYIETLEEDNRLFVTARNKIFRQKEKSIRTWIKHEKFYHQREIISAVAKLSTGNYAVGTNQSGLFIVNRNGDVIQNIDHRHGLQSNNIHEVYEDNNGNLWVALDNGIDYIQLASPFTFLQGINDNIGTVYTTLYHNDKLYMGSNRGLFYLEEGSAFNKFEAIPLNNTSSQVWSIDLIDNKIFVAMDGGAYILEENKLKEIANVTGSWKYLSLDNHDGYILCGTYNGFVLFQNVNGKIRFKRNINGFDVSSRIFQQDESGNIWVAHGYQGIYKLRINDELSRFKQVHYYDSTSGLPDKLFNSVFKVNKKIYFGTTNGVYEFDAHAGRMHLSPDFKGLIDTTTHVRRLKEAPNGDIWYIAGENTGILHRFSDGTYHAEEKPFNRLRKSHLPGFENIDIIDNKHVLICTQSGLLHYDPQFEKDYKMPFQALIHEVRIQGAKDSLIYGNDHEMAYTAYMKLNPVISLPYKHNQLSFSYSATWFEDIEENLFSYKLKGFDDNWSAWTHENRKEYTNIPEGSYSFLVKAKNTYGNESTLASFEFLVLAPWYRTNLAYTIYILTGIVFIGVLVYFKNKQFTREKKKLKLEQLKELRLKHAKYIQEKLKAEKAQMELNKKELESHIKMKNSKLASSTLNVAHKNEVLSKIKADIDDVIKHNDPKEKDRKLNKIVNTLNSEMRMETQWEQFEELFNQIHDRFLYKLKKCYPDLTPRDIRLCAYLRMNLSSKEIAPLIGLSVRGVEDMRYRLRKKFHLDKEENLTEFILTFDTRTPI